MTFPVRSYPVGGARVAMSAESFGIQFWAVTVVVGIVTTVKHSPMLASVSSTPDGLVSYTLPAVAEYSPRKHHRPTVETTTPAESANASMLECSHPVQAAPG